MNPYTTLFQLEARWEDGDLSENGENDIGASGGAAKSTISCSPLSIAVK